MINTLLVATIIATNLPPVLVEAFRPVRAATDSPFQVSHLSAADIRDTGEHDVIGVLKQLPAMTVFESAGGNPSLSQVTMRGYGENGFGRTLLMVDGERYDNADLSATDFSRIPITSISQMDILCGPQTVLYGDAASAGVVKVITDPASYDQRTYLAFYGGDFNTFGVSLGTRGGDAEYGVTYRADSGWTHSDGWREHSGYDLWRARGLVRKNFANGSFLRFSAWYDDSQYELPGPLSAIEAKEFPRHSTYDDWGRVSNYGFSFYGRGVLNDENEVSLAMSMTERLSHFTNGDYTSPQGVFNRYNRDYHGQLWQWRFAPRFVNTTRLIDFDNRFTSGLEFRWNCLRGSANTHYPDYGGIYDTCEKYVLTRNVLGIFLHDEFFLCDEFSFSGGTRYERNWNRNDYALMGGNIYDLVAGEVAANWRPIKTAKVFLRWCRFYRNPFMDEYRYQNYVASETTSPETGWNVEFGGAYDFAQEWFVSGVFYYSENSNEIYYNPFTMSNENATGVYRRQGAQFTIGWVRDKIASVRLSWNGVIAENGDPEYSGNRVPGVPAQQIMAHGRLWIVDDFSVSGGFRMMGSRYAISDMPNGNGLLPTVCVFELGCRYVPTIYGIKGLSISFQIENLLDRRYAGYAVASVTGRYNNYYPAQGRSFMFSVRYEF